MATWRCSAGHANRPLIGTMKYLLWTVIALLATGSSSSAMSRGDMPAAKKAGAGNSLKKPEQKPWGTAGNPNAVNRTVNFSITERIRLLPDYIDVVQGETLKIVLTNNGSSAHEFVIGTRQSLEEHAALMVQYPDRVHDELFVAQVPAGKTAEIVWTFNTSGTFNFACPIAGHYLPNIIGTINVAAAR